MKLLAGLCLFLLVAPGWADLSGSKANVRVHGHGARHIDNLFHKRAPNGLRALDRGNGTATPYNVKEPPLTTPWTYNVGTDPWTEYPRPQRQRRQWKSLNGIWTYQNASSLDAVHAPPVGQTLSHEVLVPSCLESGLSGIQGNRTIYSWFATQFTVPPDWTAASQRIQLNFGAVDYEATIFINGQMANFHRGGYFEFSVDATPFLSPGGTNELLVFVHDPTDDGDYVIPVGKQTLMPSHIFYTPCSGIWQNVWIEPVPMNHIERLDVNANMHGEVNITVHTANRTGTAVVSILEAGSNQTLVTQTGPVDQPIALTVTAARRWSPDAPFLYPITVQVGDDRVRSYTGFRTISRGVVNGVMRPLLNGEPIFLMGTLDQGYWPDGIYTPPSRDAMVYDLHVLKKLGFNMVRKHIKVEPALYYQACDELGLMVIQDMPSLRALQTKTLANCSTVDILPNATQQAEFDRQLERLVYQLKNHPSIITWIIYNEGWGQVIPGYPEFRLTDRVRQIDPTRLVDSNSGWHDHGAGDYSDNHHYANPQCGTPFYSTQSSPHDPKRIGFQGEFGGVGNNISINHLWNVPAAINSINQTYEIDANIDVWNYRGHVLLSELRDQTARFECSGAVWTQTTDVEGEVNGLLTYDRRMLRAHETQWATDIQALYNTLAERVQASAVV